MSKFNRHKMFRAKVQRELQQMLTVATTAVAYAEGVWVQTPIK
jgi:hypothetical protein